ncbi:MAG: hypothetical protein ACKVT2_09225 [Saprospiraceae bacterium]
MTTEAKQNTIIRHIVQTTDTKVLDQVLSLLRGKQDNAQSDWWQQITDYERDLLLRGAAQASEGKTKPHAKVGHRIREIIEKHSQSEQ